MTTPTLHDAPRALRLQSLTKSFGDRDIVDELNLDVAEGELVCLLGPSGCGKTTTLRMIGGFEPPNGGTIRIGGRDVTGLPPERRPTAMVFQNYALWPHMTVLENVAFGLKVRRVGRDERTRRATEVLNLVGLGHHLHSKPAQISGGEQQRVALARALVLEPTVLLLDEPLSNLDAKLRVRVRDEIREIQQRLGMTMVFVTHDQEEALALADRIAVMNGGRIEQLDRPADLYRRPATPFVARFVGTMNLFDAMVQPGGSVLVGEVMIPVADTDDDIGFRLVGVRPEDIVLSGDGPGPIGAVVRDVPLGHYREVTVRLGTVDVRAFVGADDTVPETVHVTARRAVTFPADNA
jgi:putative spermidine/putrescine transport system ATP-binding protein